MPEANDAESEDVKQKKKPFSNFFSNVFFCWVFPLIVKGFRRDLELDDVYRLDSAYQAQNLKERLERGWDKEIASGKRNDENEPSLFRAILRAFGWDMGFLVFLGLVFNVGVKTGQCLAMGAFLQYFQGQVSIEWAYVAASGLVILTLSNTILFHTTIFLSQAWAMKVRVALCSSIYNKSLRLSQTSLGVANIGQITNLMSNDVNRFDRYAIQLPYIIIAPFQFMAVAYALWWFMGISALAGIILVLLLTPSQGFTSSYFTKLRRMGCDRTDVRLSLMNEIVNGILLIKMFCWEKPFAAQVVQARELEMQTILKKTRLYMLNKGVFPVFGKLVVLVMLIAYVLTGNLLNAIQIFVVLALVETLRLSTMECFPISVLGWAEICVSLRRIQKFLMLEERSTKSITSCTDSEELDDGHVHGVSMTKFCAKWKPGIEYTLEDVDLEIRSGELVSIVGHVGSGKSALLFAILKEMPPIFGSVRRSGSLAYASQDPWLFAGTIRENILFGLGFNPIWYAQVLEACALNADLAGFPYGDNTLIYDRGVNLSGGQKARVNLARAVYSNAQIYLLDDPLSAVDAKAGRHIFEKCILGLLKDKAVLLVTHQLQFLDAAHNIIMLSNGQVEAQGTLAELRSRGHLKGTSTQPEVSFEIEDNKIVSDESALEMGLTSSPTPSNASSETSLVSESPVKAKYGTFASKQRRESEETSTGLVGIRVYWRYCRSGTGLCFLMIMFLSFVFCQALLNGSDVWLEIWTSKETGIKDELTANTLPELEEMDYLWIYAGLVALLFIFSIIRYQLIGQVFTNSSVALHKSLLNAVIRAPMRFFEVNSAGRVFNRFSNDVGIMDETVTQVTSTTVTMWLDMLGAQVIVALTSPMTAIPGIGLLVFMYLMVAVYLRTGSSLKRLEAVHRSPVFEHVTTSLNGMPTIRASSKVNTFIHRYYTLQDIHSSASYLGFAASRWLGVTVDWFTNLYFVIIVFGFFFINTNVAIVGLAISTAVQMTTSISWTGNRTTDQDSIMVAVERIIQYSRVEPEAALEIPDNKPPKSWPKRGEIQFREICVQYGNNAPVLRNINCYIQGGEKVGIVGRTGAGKSSLIAALFRIVEPSSGQIIIDGYNVLEVGLHDLRSNIAIIPQNPILFKGTMRRNLDPLDQHTDAQLWNCLAQVYLTDRVQRDSEAGLDSAVSEGGSNFSQGEKQLICLARALLCQTKILVLDEATSNMDSETDALIQRVVAELFEKSTILTIAHRLDTVMKCDRILVLDKGTILEFDEPFALLQSKGRLYELVERTGVTGSAHLMQLAKEAHDLRTGNTL